MVKVIPLSFVTVAVGGSGYDEGWVDLQLYCCVLPSNSVHVLRGDDWKVPLLALLSLAHKNPKHEAKIIPGWRRLEREDASKPDISFME